MKKSMMNSQCKSVFAVVLLMAAVCLPVAAEEMGPLDKRFDLDFGGGSVEQILIHVKEALPNLNIIVIDDEFASSALVPPINLKQTNCRELWDILDTIAENFSGSVGNSNTMFVQYHDPSLSQMTFPPPTTLFVYPMAPLLEVHASKEIFGVIGEAYNIMGVPRPNFSFNEETSMLMASLTEEQFRIVQGVLEKLEPITGDSQQMEELKTALENAERKNPSIATDSDQVEELKEAVKNIETENQSLSQNMAKLEAEMEEIRERNYSLHQRLEALQAEIRQLASDLENVRNAVQ